MSLINVIIYHIISIMSKIIDKSVSVLIGDDPEEWTEILKTTSPVNKEFYCDKTSKAISSEIYYADNFSPLTEFTSEDEMARFSPVRRHRQRSTTSESFEFDTLLPHTLSSETSTSDSYEDRSIVYYMLSNHPNYFL